MGHLPQMDREVSYWGHDEAAEYPYENDEYMRMYKEALKHD